MSYCRFASGDAYVFYNSENFYECCGCHISDSGSFECARSLGMLWHLQAHRQAGHKIPGYAFSRLQKEARREL